ncbi:MAG: SGNH/GDSL hydrolase family protein [Phycisphaerales bacterium]|nr:SGNH/GDSL hydrolase family protein [Phycisphaerales bacterium]
MRMMAAWFMATWMAATIQPAIAQITWADAGDLLVEGRGFSDCARPYDRLPARAEGLVRNPVWNLSRDSAGIVVRFQTDAPEIHARWTLTDPKLAMPHMPATGVSGVDLYARMPDGSWRWVANGRPGGLENEARLMRGVEPALREFMLYLPLYNGIESVAIGVPGGRVLQPGPKRVESNRKPVVFYGTSITHGGCASRPGMAHVAILGRRLDRPVVNLGFSGNGTMDIEIADLMAEIDAAVYVIDCLPNLNGEAVQARAVPFVKRLRELRPNVPIVLVEDRTYDGSEFSPGRANRNRENRAALSAARDSLLAEGFENLHYIEGGTLLGADGEATVDGSHPTDLGFLRQADAMQPVLQEALRN